MPGVCAPSVLVLVTFCLAVPSAAPASVPRWPVWLCLPGRSDSCAPSTSATVVGASGAETTVRLVAERAPPVDCFYVYPTVSQQRRGNSTLAIQVDEQAVALQQASQFASVCRVYAPMYRQETSDAARYHGSFALAYANVLAAWRAYLAHDNDGRGVVLIGHSQGASILEQLLQQAIEGRHAQKLLVSAILLGGDVVVRDGSTSGGTFSRIPACTAAAESGCVVAYSTWSHTPPPNARFEDVSNPRSEHVLCVNPAAPGSARATPITPLFPNFDSGGLAPLPGNVSTIVWYAFPDLYRARCVREGTRAWLLVTRINHAGDPRPTVQEILAPSWGLHAADVNVDLVNLVALVQSETRAWLAHR